MKVHHIKAQLGLEVIEVSRFLAIKQDRDAPAPCTETCSTATAVQIRLLLHWHIQVDNNINLLDVYTTGKEIRADQNTVLERFHTNKGLCTPGLFHSRRLMLLSTWICP